MSRVADARVCLCVCVCVWVRVRVLEPPRLQLPVCGVRQSSRRPATLARSFQAHGSVDLFPCRLRSTSLLHSASRARQVTHASCRQDCRRYLSIPLSNRLCKYEEYYEISREAHDGYPERGVA